LHSVAMSICAVRRCLTRPKRPSELTVCIMTWPRQPGAECSQGLGGQLHSALPA
jgi:hypothetical protein